MPMQVMPTWTLDRKRVGSDESVSACLAPALPVSAICSRRARLDPTIAISDIAKMPFRKMRIRRSETSVSMHLSWNSGVQWRAHFTGWSVPPFLTLGKDVTGNFRHLTPFDVEAPPIAKQRSPHG